MNNSNKLPTYSELCYIVNEFMDRQLKINEEMLRNGDNILKLIKIFTNILEQVINDKK